MADEDHEHTSGNIGAAVQRFEGVRLAIAIQHDVVLDLLESLGRGQLVGRQDLALKVLGLGLIDFKVCARYGLSWYPLGLMWFVCLRCWRWRCRRGRLCCFVRLGKCYLWVGALWVGGGGDVLLRRGP